jgi:hypothetical protein
MTDDPFGIEEAKQRLAADVNESELIEEIVTLQNELESSGAYAVMKQIEELRTMLKERMMKNLKDYAVDEVSGHYAEIQVRTKTVYGVDELKELLGDKAARYIVEQVDPKKIERGLKNGDLSVSMLEGSGAMGKQPTSAALYIKKLGDANVGK